MDTLNRKQKYKTDLRVAELFPTPEAAIFMREYLVWEWDGIGMWRTPKNSGGGYYVCSEAELLKYNPVRVLSDRINKVIAAGAARVAGRRNIHGKVITGMVTINVPKEYVDQDVFVEVTLK